MILAISDVEPSDVLSPQLIIQRCDHGYDHRPNFVVPNQWSTILSGLMAMIKSQPQVSSVWTWANHDSSNSWFPIMCSISNRQPTNLYDPTVYILSRLHIFWSWRTTHLPSFESWLSKTCSRSTTHAPLWSDGPDHIGISGFAKLEDYSPPFFQLLIGSPNQQSMTFLDPTVEISSSWTLTLWVPTTFPLTFSIYESTKCWSTTTCPLDKMAQISSWLQISRRWRTTHLPSPDS